MDNLRKLKKEYYSMLDKKAKSYSDLVKNGREITPLLLEDIHSLYLSAKVESDFSGERFESAYHNPVTSEFEFLVSRIIYYTHSDLSVFLRRQFNKTAPDIRMERGGKTIAIIEIKSKAGWMQPFFSKEREQKYLEKFNSGRSNKDPRKQIEEIRHQLLKYSANFKIGKDRIFLLIPTFASVHRKNSHRTLGDYLNDFETNSTLSKDNLIVLSSNLSLYLGKKKLDKNELKPTDRLERFLISLKHMK